jgi:hypothetical protein
MRRLGQMMAVLIVLAVSAGLIHAAATPAQKCAASKVKAGSKKIGAQLKCISKAIGKGIAVDPACLATASTKFNTAVGKAETKGGCVFTGDGGSLEGLVDNDSNAIVAVTTTTPINCCANNFGADYCTYEAEPNCLADGGVPGAAGTVCDSVSGGCTAPPARAGRTCSSDTALFGFSSPLRCFAGPLMSASFCVGAIIWPDPNEVLADPNAICPPNGGRAVD